MFIECFAGDARLEGDDADAIVEAFLRHAAEDHDWSYPEKALRNYARNCAEAQERVTGPTERLDQIGEVTIQPVTVDRIDDWLDFFDHDGFAGNPDWASCYCLEPHAPPTEDEPERAWRETRAMMIERLRGGGTFGYLAYVDSFFGDGASPMSTEGPPGGSTPRSAPTTGSSSRWIPADPNRARWWGCRVSSSLRPTGGTGSPRCCWIG